MQVSFSVPQLGPTYFLVLATPLCTPTQSCAFMLSDVVILYYIEFTRRLIRTCGNNSSGPVGTTAFFFEIANLYVDCTHAAMYTVTYIFNQHLCDPHTKPLALCVGHPDR